MFEKSLKVSVVVARGVKAEDCLGITLDARSAQFEKAWKNNLRASQLVGLDFPFKIVDRLESDFVEGGKG